GFQRVFRLDGIRVSSIGVSIRRIEYIYSFNRIIHAYNIVENIWNIHTPSTDRGITINGVKKQIKALPTLEKGFFRAIDCDASVCTWCVYIPYIFDNVVCMNYPVEAIYIFNPSD
ncbi:hypothetical protein EZS27_043796, partial [termite gut metagenome]